MKKICTIAIPVWNKIRITRQCLESIVLHTRYPHRVLVIDNGSDEETKRFLEDFCKGRENFEIKRFDENMGYLNAANYALSSIKTAYICLLNNDTILTMGWLSECIAVMESRNDIGVVSPTTNEINVRFKKIFDSGEIYKYKGVFIEVNNCIGSCFIVKKEVIDAIGIFDTVYGDGYFEEVDHCFKAKKAGFDSVLALGAYINHISSASFEEMPERKKTLWHKNRAIFESRWGMSDRILFFVRGDYDDMELSRAKSYILEQCRKRAIIDLYFKGSRKWIANTHFNIREKNCLLYNFFTLYLVLKLKKKAYDKVITDIRVSRDMMDILGDKLIPMRYAIK